MTSDCLLFLSSPHHSHDSNERTRFEQEIRNLIQLHKQNLQEYIDEAEKRHQMEMNEVEERKSFQLTKLIEEHEAKMIEMRNYFNEITRNNLTLIENLKEQLSGLQVQLADKERQLMLVSSLCVVTTVNEW